MDTSSVIQRIRDGGFGGFEGPIIDALLPCVRFGKARPPGPGGSKLDGTPDLPAGTPWPQDVNGRPLAFLGQFNLVDCTVDSPQWRLPRTGLLSFFYDAENQPWGHDAGDYSSWRVLYHEVDPKELEPVNAPRGLSKEFICAPTGLTPIPGWSLPSHTTIKEISTPLANFADSRNERLHPAYCDLIESLDQPNGALDPSPQLGGWPREEQGNMPRAFVADFTPRDPDAPPEYYPNPFRPSERIRLVRESQTAPPPARRLSESSDDWRLLLQLPSTDDWCWGDMGKLYFWIAGRSLAERRFDETWMILQCG